MSSDAQKFGDALDRRQNLETWLEEKADEDPDLHAAVLEALGDTSITVPSLVRALADVGLEISVNPVYRWRQKQK